jgi:hypothetical protein
MALVVMVLMTSGMVLSRYLKLIFPWWFYAHTAIFFLALFFMAVSAVLIFRAHGSIFYAVFYFISFSFDEYLFSYSLSLSFRFIFVFYLVLF